LCPFRALAAKSRRRRGTLSAPIHRRLAARRDGKGEKMNERYFIVCRDDDGTMVFATHGYFTTR
jgi:hypothetical protein